MSMHPLQSRSLRLVACVPTMDIRLSSTQLSVQASPMVRLCSCPRSFCRGASSPPSSVCLIPEQLRLLSLVRDSSCPRPLHVSCRGKIVRVTGTGQQVSRLCLLITTRWQCGSPVHFIWSGGSPPPPAYLCAAPEVNGREAGVAAGQLGQRCISQAEAALQPQVLQVLERGGLSQQGAEVEAALIAGQV